ncbi:MAG: GNAT family N-acetyltransferase [Verrucomicrobiota bacterium]|jgi:ribosomal protein S18 acetylase RimI-like enzyme|nr:GNAT family N-acetyltransferase [Verrucomicrobiota bacterium]MDP7050914.1 GNAT family N-acetyltransferase [Verrucomicrobiota bacterium]
MIVIAWNKEMNVTICRATADDVGALSKLFNAYRVFFGQDGDLSLAEEFLRRRLNNSESIIFFAYTSDKHCVGFAQLYPSFSSVSAERIWILNDLFVLESLRGMGIGKKLLCEIEAFCEETQAGGIVVETTTSNTGARRLYESNGYQKVPDRVFYERKNQPKNELD